MVATCSWEFTQTCFIVFIIQPLSMKCNIHIWCTKICFVVFFQFLSVDILMESRVLRYNSEGRTVMSGTLWCSNAINQQPDDSTLNWNTCFFLQALREYQVFWPSRFSPNCYELSKYLIAFNSCHLRLHDRMMYYLTHCHYWAAMLIGGLA